MAAAAAGASTNGARSTVPSKRRNFSTSSYEDRPPPPPPGTINTDVNGTGDQQFLQGNIPSAGPGPNSTPSLRTPSPARTDLMSGAPLPTILTSPQDTFRPLQSFPTEEPLSAAGGRPWFDQPFPHPLDKMDGSSVQVQAAQGAEPPSATPEGFSWSALVEGMLDTSPHPAGDFAWLNNTATNAAPPNGPAPPMGLPTAPRINPPSNGQVPGTSPSGSVHDFGPEASLSPSQSGGGIAPSDGTVQPL
jgi:hypothetical protein